MKIFIGLFFISALVISCNICAQADSVHLILDEPYNDALPRNFRKCSGEFIRLSGKLPDTTGLSSLNISGSSEFSDKNLPVLLNAIGNFQVNVLDLRQE